MLEKIIQILLERLEIREQTCIPVSRKEIDTADDSLFIKAKTIRITGVDATCLETLTNGRNEEIMIWLERAKSYGVIVELELFDTGEAWLAPEKLLQISYPVFGIDGTRLAHVTDKVICYKDVASLSSDSLLLTYKHQLLTHLAKEHLDKQHIAVRERE